MEEKNVSENKKQNDVVHMQPGTCPGQEYFDRKSQEEEERMKRILSEVLGDVPHYMKLAGENRIWLWLLTFLTIVDTGLIISVLLVISRIPK
jgi:hypothetical protein